MLTIIEIKARDDGGHGLQSQSHRTENWEGPGWIEVPPQLERAVWDCCGYCDLILEDGKLTGITPGVRPPEPEPEPTKLDYLRADVDFLAALSGVSL